MISQFPGVTGAFIIQKVCEIFCDGLLKKNESPLIGSQIKITEPFLIGLQSGPRADLMKQRYKPHNCLKCMGNWGEITPISGVISPYLQLVGAHVVGPKSL